MALDRSLFSLVIPVFDEEEVLPELIERVTAAVAGLGFDRTEILFVDDGSTDGTEPILRAACEGGPGCRALVLTRNFGHQAAVWTGLEAARGSVVAVLDGDLQDPPEVLASMIEVLDRGADVAYGVRRRRKESLPKRIAYRAFYRLLRRLASVDVPLDSGDFCCMRRPVLDAMRKLPERQKFVRGLRAWVGFRQVGVEYERAARAAGRSAYSFRALVRLAYDGLFGFSEVPVRVMQMLGFAASVFAMSVAGYYTIWYFIDPVRFPSGFATITVSLWFLAGVQLLFMGIVGEYVVRALDEARGRPVALVREIVGRDDERTGPRPTH